MFILTITFDTRYFTATFDRCYWQLLLITKQNITLLTSFITSFYIHSQLAEDLLLYLTKYVMYK